MLGEHLVSVSYRQQAYTIHDFFSPSAMVDNLNVSATLRPLINVAPSDMPCQLAACPWALVLGRLYPSPFLASLFAALLLR